MPNKGKDVPLPRIVNSIDYFNGSLYLCGYSILYQKYEVGKNFFRYDLSTESWELVQTQGDTLPRSVTHFSCIYNDELYIVFGGIYESLKQYNTVYKYNFSSKNWTLITSFPGYEVFFGASVFVSPVLYIFFGRSLLSIKNSVVSIDLSSKPPKLKLLSKNWVSPSKRFHHCSFVVNRDMYIFGGSLQKTGEAASYYNDLWAYNFDSDSWQVVAVEGDQPSPRESFGCLKISGDVIIVYGGKGYDGIYDDLYYFHILEKKWYKVSPSNSPPNGRCMSCLAYQDNILYIIGGTDNKKAYGEIWTYDFITNLYEKLPIPIFPSEGLNSLGLYDSQCWIDYKYSTVFLNIIGGNNYILDPNDLQITIKIFSNYTYTIQTQTLGSEADLSLIGSETSVIITEDYIIRLGGSIYSWRNLPNIVIHNRVSKSITPISTNNVFESYGHSAVHFNKSIYVFGGGGTNELFTSNIKINNNLLIISLQDHINLSCSPGNVGDDCTPCGFGTYYDQGSCAKCPAGRFSRLLSSTDITQCIPCQAGSYSSKPGARTCLDCPTGYSCPLGSAHLLYSFTLPQNSSFQPAQYSDQGSYVSNVTSQMWYVALGLTLLVMFVSASFKWLWTRIHVLDIYSSHHEAKLGVPVVLKKNTIGGVFSLIYFFGIGVMLVSALLSFNINNIAEIRTLVPKITLTTPIEAEYLSVNTTFYVYGGNCIGSSQGVCHSMVTFHSSPDLSYKSLEFSCYFYQGVCQVFLKFKKVSLLAEQVSIDVLLKEDTSYASAISLNLSSASSIPLEKSTILTTASPGTQTNLFRGTTPTKFYFKFTPSLFENQVSKWPAQLTGFHISQSQNADIGSVADNKTLYLRKNLGVAIQISQSDTALYTQRSLIQSWFVFISGLLGSIFGLSGSIVTAMGFFEQVIEEYQKKVNKRKIFAELIKNSHDLKAAFGFFKRHAKPEQTYTSFSVVTK